MKRLLSILMIFILAIVIIGCEKDEDAVFRDQTYDDIGEVLSFFETPLYEDLEFSDSNADAQMQGLANILMYDIETINTIVIKDNISIMLTIYLTEDSNRIEMIIEEVDITYVDLDKELYIELWFYKDNLFDIGENFTLERNVLDFNRGLRRFTIEDYQTLLYDIGYKEVKSS